VISVPITDDTLFENDQTFTVRLSSARPTGVVVDNATARSPSRRTTSRPRRC
jgi:hypothetical protein